MGNRDDRAAARRNRPWPVVVHSIHEEPADQWGTMTSEERVALVWTLDLVLKRDIVEISVRRTRARPGETPGEMAGEPVSVGARPEAPDELVL